MKFFTLIIILFTSITTLAQKPVDKERFNNAVDLMKEKNYHGAIDIWLELEKEHPYNANIQFSIGDCYMNSKYEKTKSIPYFKKAQKQLTDDYKKGNHKETLAPLETLYWLGKAYHISYQFDKAIEKYMEYRDILFDKNFYLLKSLLSSLVKVSLL